MIIKEKIILSIGTLIAGNKTARNFAIKKFEKNIYKLIVENKNDLLPLNARIERFEGTKSIYSSILRNLDKGIISKDIAKKWIETLLTQVFFETENIEKIRLKFKERYDVLPPLFITIAPTKRCNLNCIGCYASSTAKTAETLEWSLLDKIMTELHDEMGMRFFVITGGEPLIYKSEGKTILDLARKWKDSFFLMYTNGTLITQEVAKEMAELGNITPAISVEGFEKETDERRGKGVYQRFLYAIKDLKKEGVPFGVSVTATKNNIDTLLTTEFYKYYFEDLGASYMWMFQYMPIGRKFTTELMISPQQRFDLLKKWREIIKEKKYFVADFWNSGVLSKGCISCGKQGGYFYIDWNGNIMPCVFVPYYKDNVRKLYSEDKKIADSLFSDFFVKGREWQTNYYDQNGKCGNLLRPCFIRDHHKTFVKITKECNVIPEDEAAKDALKDEDYHKELIKFDEELKNIEDPYWEEEYCKDEKII